MPVSSDDFEHWNDGTKPGEHSVLQTVDTIGMPTFARVRLQEHIKNPRAPFTSNLSVNELLLTRRAKAIDRLRRCWERASIMSAGA